MNCLISLCLLFLFLRIISTFQHSFCWRNSYLRRIGGIPNICPSDLEKIGLFCYSKCPSGYYRFLFDCHPSCPPEWRDDGLFCRLAEYGRGVGYPWHFFDGFTDEGMFKRCEEDYGAGNCEKWGAIVYPKCRAGYHNFGCCICRPETPDCDAMGLGGQFDLSCAKKIILGDPHLMICESGEMSAFLCYPPCENGFTGVGPLCVGKTPKGWVDCGLGAAINGKNCAFAIFDQITSVSQIAFNIASLFSSSAVVEAATTVSKSEKISKLSEFLAILINLYDTNKDFFQNLKDAERIIWCIEKLIISSETLTEPVVNIEEIIRTAAELISLIDPTGISNFISAFSYPKCSDLKFLNYVENIEMEKQPKGIQLIIS